MMTGGRPGGRVHAANAAVWEPIPTTDFALPRACPRRSLRGLRINPPNRSAALPLCRRCGQMARLPLYEWARPMRKLGGRRRQAAALLSFGESRAFAGTGPVRRIVRRVSEGDLGHVLGPSDGAPLPDAEQIKAFRTFGRPVTEADRVLSEASMEGLPDHLNLSLGRCVYCGPEGRSYAVPGPGSICFIASGEAIGTLRGETTTALAAEGGDGFVCTIRGRPVTFVGMLPAGGYRLQVRDRAGQSITVPLSADEGDWLEVSDPTATVLIRPDGTTRETSLSRGELS